MLKNDAYAGSSGRRSDPSNIAGRIEQRSCSASTSPLYWWRTLQPKDLGRWNVRAIRAALLQVDVVDDGDWLHAVTGCPAEAIGVAIRVLKTFGMNNPITDAVVSAALCCALEGDHAARELVLSALRRRQKIGPRVRAESLRLFNDRRLA